MNTVLVRPIVEDPTEDVDIRVFLGLILEEVLRLEDYSFREGLGESGSSFVDNIAKVLNDAGEFGMGFRNSHSQDALVASNLVEIRTSV